MKLASKPRFSSGFTIIELLVVIVVIGILAAITIVAYNGVTQKARVAVLQSDLSNARDTLEIANAQNNGTYPGNLSAAQAAGLKASSGTTYQYSHTTTPDDGYCLTATNSGTSYYIDTDSHTTPTAGACPGDVDGGDGSVLIADGALIQTITDTNCPSTLTRAVDARDNHTYWVEKLADGKCWMLTNLAYAGGGTNTYNDTKTLANGTGGSATYTVARYYVPTGSNVTTEPATPSTSRVGTGQYGYLYNWCGAMGAQTSTSACANATTPLPNATISVCPSGWRLPTGNGGGEFTALNTAINGGSDSTDAGLFPSWLAQLSGIWSSGFIGLGVSGGYWSSSQYSASEGYLLSFERSDMEPSNDNDKSQGYAIRCIAS